MTLNEEEAWVRKCDEKLSQQRQRWMADTAIRPTIREMMQSDVLPDAVFDVNYLRDADVQYLANLANQLPEISLAMVIKGLTEMAALGRPLNRARRFLLRKRLLKNQPLVDAGATL